MSSNPIMNVLILGLPGTTPAATLIQRLLNENCRVIVGNVKPDHELATVRGFLPASIDLTNAEKCFADLEAARIQHLGEHGWFNVVIYRAFHLEACRHEDPTRSLSLDVGLMRLAAETDIHCVYAAAKFALQGFEQLSVVSAMTNIPVPRVFIIGGNAMPFLEPPLERWLSLGYGRVTQSYLIKSLATYHSPRSGGQQQFYYVHQVENQLLAPGLLVVSN
ncbi:hypothetical protein DL93DRAFT_1186616 [Clavulina sp. PMI_390]|nr:hypothetical protein DL93DRAFT_1186616 [Clavulina sp. PMI_390]